MGSDNKAPIVVEGGKLVDGTGKKALEDSLVLIEGNRVKAVSQVGKIPYPSNASVINARGKTVLPGLWDTHVHYRDWMAELYLAHGVTTIVDLGSDSTPWILAQRDGVAKGKIRGPRVFAVGAGIGHPPGRAGHVKDVAEAEALVTELLEQGVDAVKVWAYCTSDMLRVVAREAHARGRKVIGHLGVIAGRDAALQGLDCMAHATGLPMSVVRDSEKSQWMLNQEIKRLQTMIIGEPGITAWGLFAMMEEDMFEEAAEFFVKEDVRIEPDFVYRWQLASRKREEREYEDFVIYSDPRLSYIPEVNRWRNLRSWQVYRRLNEQQLRELKEGYEKFVKFLHVFVKAGGKLDCGTDTSDGRMPGRGVHRELEFLVDAGFSPSDVIEWATKACAEFLDKADELGTVEQGKIADLIVVSGDPLRDITQLRNIDVVIKDGALMDTGYHADYSNPIPMPFKGVIHAYPKPRLSAITPEITAESEEEVTLKLQGEGFINGSVVEFGGHRIPTRVVSAKEIEATIPSRFVGKVGTSMVIVVNPGPVSIRDPLHEDERSNPMYFMVKFK